MSIELMKSNILTGAVTAPRRRHATRGRAFLVHLGISLLIFAGLMYMIVFHWYPEPYFSYDGGWRGTMIMVGVDLVLGPMLTLIVYDPRKPTAKLRFDLTVIALIQVSALAWGLHLVEGQRPAAIAYRDGAFTPVTAQVLRDQGVLAGAPRALGPERPPLVFTTLPSGDALARVAETGLRPHNLAQLHAPLAPHLDEVASRQEDVAQLAGRPHFDEELRAFLDARGAQREDYVFVPFDGRYKRVLFVLDGDARLVGVLTRAYEGLL